MAVVEGDRDPATDEAGQTGHRVGRETRLALFAVGDDRGAGLVEAAKGVAHGVIEQGIELLRADVPGRGGRHAI